MWAGRWCACASRWRDRGRGARINRSSRRRRKTDLDLDNPRVQQGMAVKARPAKHRHEIEMFILPSYSPELNSDEMANADRKQTVIELAPAR